MADVTQADLAEIYRKLDTISTSVVRIESTCPSCRELVQRNTQAIRGNGQGLITRTSILEQVVAELNTAQKTSENNPKLSLRQWAAIFALVGAMGFAGSLGGSLAQGPTRTIGDGNQQPAQTEQP